MSNSKYTIILFYKYTEIDDSEKLRDAQKELCKALNLKGRIIVASEGINGTLEGKDEDIKKYIEEMKRDDRFKDVDFKVSDGTGQAFPKLTIKARDEIVSGHFGEKDVRPWEKTGKHIKPEELRKLIKSGKDFYIVDMRNDFEQKSGYFEGSVLPGMGNFRDLPKVLETLSPIKNKPVVTVCTGGVRCEKASGFLLNNGFSEVYQLEGGIVRYMEKYPGEDFKGSLYVFDNRLTMNFGEHEVVGRCESCQVPSENYINCQDDVCHRHFIMCENCTDENNQALCPNGCRKDRFGKLIDFGI